MPQLALVTELVTPLVQVFLLAQALAPKLALALAAAHKLPAEYRQGHALQSTKQRTRHMSCFRSPVPFLAFASPSSFSLPPHLRLRLPQALERQLQQPVPQPAARPPELRLPTQMPARLAVLEPLHSQTASCWTNSFFFSFCPSCLLFSVAHGASRDHSLDANVLVEADGDHTALAALHSLAEYGAADGEAQDGVAEAGNHKLAALRRLAEDDGQADG